MNMTMLAEIETLAQQARDDLASFHEEFTEAVGDINVRLQRLEYGMADANRDAAELHHKLVACNAQLDGIDARLQRVEDALDRRGA